MNCRNALLQRHRRSVKDQIGICQRGILCADTGKIAQGAREHTVRPGETLAMIAVRYQVGVATLRSTNSLKTDELKIGQNLNIPASELVSKQ